MINTSRVKPHLRFVPIGLLSLVLLPVMLLVRTSGNPLLHQYGGIEFHGITGFLDLIGPIRFFRFEPQDFPRSPRLEALAGMADSARAHLIRPDDAIISLSRTCKYEDFIRILDILDRSGFSSAYEDSSIFTGYGSFYAGPSPIEAPWLKNMSLLKRISYNLRSHNYVIINRTEYVLDALHDNPWLYSVLLCWALMCKLNFYRLVLHSRWRREAVGRKRTNGGAQRQLA